MQLNSPYFDSVSNKATSKSVTGLERMIFQSTTKHLTHHPTEEATPHRLQWTLPCSRDSLSTIHVRLIGLFAQRLHE